MIERLSGRSAFARLRAEGRRSSRGPIRIVHRDVSPLVADERDPDAPGNGLPRGELSGQTTLMETHLAAGLADTSSARLAFAIPRKVGSAVVRNRTKRRLRAVLTEIDRREPELLRGDYLVRVTAPLERWSSSELAELMTDVLTDARTVR